MEDVMTLDPEASANV